jgi:transposase
VRVPLTPGQRHEMTQAAALAGGPRAGWLIADAAFDADAFRRGLAEAGTAAVIPSSPSRARAVPRDRDLHKDHHVVECFFAKLEQFRRIATRHKKTAANFLALVHLACAVISMR